ncbi:hypothetical protein NPIL_245231, partial [Nephila pilipes]
GLFTYDSNIENVKKRVDTYHLDFLKEKTAKETFKAILRTCSDFDDSALTHVDCMRNSSLWNMVMFSILRSAKGALPHLQSIYRVRKGICRPGVEELCICKLLTAPITKLYRHLKSLNP